MVLPLDMSNPATVLSTAVYSATAAEVGEVVIDSLPMPLGQHYLRTAGPASRVFGKAHWYVNPQGVTIVGPRIPLPYDPLSVDILSWDPLTRVAELASDAPISPGTILIDPLRFTTPLVVQDVEQTWSAEGGARATCWCGDGQGSRLQKALTAMVTEKAGLAYLKSYDYRIVLQDPATEALALQVIDPLCGAPLGIIPIDMWMGVPGISAKMLLGAEVVVIFRNGARRSRASSVQARHHPRAPRARDGTRRPARSRGRHAGSDDAGSHGVRRARHLRRRGHGARHDASDVDQLHPVRRRDGGAWRRGRDGPRGLTAAIAALVEPATSKLVVSD